MKRKTISLLALSLAATVSLTACTKAMVARDTKNTIENSIESTIDSTVLDSDVESIIIDTNEVSKISSSRLEFQLLLDEFYNSNRSISEILKNEDKGSLLYSSALYMKLREAGLMDDTILKELHNVVTFGLVHPSIDGWKNDLLVENLNKSINYSTDAILYYYPLAAYIHLFDCEEEHEIVEGRIKCDTIQNDLMEMNDNILFANYIVENILAMDDSAPIKIALQRIINSKEDTETCIYELENIYKLAMIPRCVTEEEMNSVIHLSNTLEERENPFEVYYDLAIFVHTLHHTDEEHYANEFGQWECLSVRQEMDAGLGLGK